MDVVAPGKRGYHASATIAADSRIRSLTALELRILRLMASGVTDRAIGMMLGIAHRSVNRHVDSILAKLGIGNRMQTVVWAVQNGIADTSPSFRRD